MTLRIDDVDVRIEPDSGAEVNIMDEHQHKALQHRSSKPQVLKASHIKLHTLQSALPVKGEFKTIVRNKTCGTETKFVVVRGRINSPPLISKDTLIKLGMIQLDPNGSLTEANDMRIPEDTLNVKAVAENTTAPVQIEEITEKFSQVFKGIGMIKDIKKGKEIFDKFSMKPEAVPVAQKPRPVAYYLQKPLREWLDLCIKEGIFEEVPQGEPVTWCSPLVGQPKPTFGTTQRDQLEPHMIRASVDLRVPNTWRGTESHKGQWLKISCINSMNAKYSPSKT